MTARPAPAADNPLVALWQSHINSAAAAHGLPPALRAGLRAAPAETVEQLLDWVAANAVDRNRLRAAIAGLQEVNGALEQQLQRLLEPPHAIARLLSYDARRHRALVGTAPASRMEVQVHADVDPTTLVAGRDVVLTGERTTVLRVLGRSWSPGSARVATFRGFVGDAAARDRATPGTADAPDPDDLDALDAIADEVATAGDVADENDGGELQEALVGDAGGDQIVWVPPDLARRLRPLLATGRRAVRIGVDEFGIATGLCDDHDADPMAAAARFRLALEPIADGEVVGLHAQRAQVLDAVRRTAERGAFVLCEGSTGTGKTHLCRHALHLLRQRGDVVVLGLRASSDHRYVGQEESDVEQLFACARALVGEGRLVLVFVDELDRHFFRSRHGESVHVNSTRATWLAQIGDDLRGILLYGTTNKSGHLPDELHNRVTHPLSFGRLDREQAHGLLDQYLPPAEVLGRDRPLVVEVLVAATHDRLAGHEVAVVTLRDQSRFALHACDLRQVSARFYRELAQRLQADAETRGPLDPARALELLQHRLAAVVQTLRLTTDNVADRSFVEFAPRNPAEHVQVTAMVEAVPVAAFRYQPLEVPDAARC